MALWHCYERHKVNSIEADLARADLMIFHATCTCGGGKFPAMNSDKPVLRCIKCGSETDLAALESYIKDYGKHRCNFCGSKHKKGTWWCKSYNPLIGCSKVSPGCDRCWAEAMARRFYPELVWDGQIRQYIADSDFSGVANDFAPLDWKKPKRIFAFSMTDFFHENIDDSVRDKYLQVIEKAHWHKFFILTKRPRKAVDYFFGKKPLTNLWLGVSCENQRMFYERWEDLVNLTKYNLFISFEPLLEQVMRTPYQWIYKHYYFLGCKWIIVGCESGPGHRPMELDWVREIRDVCVDAKIPFYFKQAYDGKKLVHLPELDGVVWDQMP